jgi:hypothetical protein
MDGSWDGKNEQTGRLKERLKNGSAPVDEVVDVESEDNGTYAGDEGGTEARLPHTVEGIAEPTGRALQVIGLGSAETARQKNLVEERARIETNIDRVRGAALDILTRAGLLSEQGRLRMQARGRLKGEFAAARDEARACRSRLKVNPTAGDIKATPLRGWIGALGEGGVAVVDLGILSLRFFFAGLPAPDALTYGALCGVSNAMAGYLLGAGMKRRTAELAARERPNFLIAVGALILAVSATAIFNIAGSGEDTAIGRSITALTIILTVGLSFAAAWLSTYAYPETASQVAADRKAQREFQRFQRILEEEENGPSATLFKAAADNERERDEALSKAELAYAEASGFNEHCHEFIDDLAAGFETRGLTTAQARARARQLSRLGLIPLDPLEQIIGRLRAF